MRRKYPVAGRWKVRTIVEVLPDVNAERDPYKRHLARLSCGHFSATYWITTGMSWRCYECGNAQGG